jgi:DNA repair exonuclease SbcCD ATPase subunit
VSTVDASLAFAAELEERDAALADRYELLDGLSRRVEEIRTEAESLARVLTRLPVDREQLDAMLADAGRNLETARAALELARAAADQARSEEAAATARRDKARAATDTRTCEERRDRLATRGKELERQAAEAGAEARSLEARARALAARLEAAPRVAPPDPPAPGLDGLVDWGSRAHAAIFVARSGVETERERVAREAHELAAAVLGEPLPATSVAGVRQRLEDRLGGA